MNKPLVGILMGSDSDLPVMQDAVKALDSFGIGSEIHVMSAHRTPDAVMEYVKKSEADGYKVFICSAGMAAHLGGVVAAHTALPVIAVPMGKSMQGVDALLAMVQMPPGVPVACVAIDGAKNAGILAAQMIGAGDKAIYDKVVAYKAKMADEVKKKDADLQAKGVAAYLKDKGLV